MGQGRPVRVLVFAKGEKEKEAREQGPIMLEQRTCRKDPEGLA
jgi:ribosomal protein L1